MPYIIYLSWLQGDDCLSDVETTVRVFVPDDLERPPPSVPSWGEGIIIIVDTFVLRVCIHICCQDN